MLVALVDSGWDRSARHERVRVGVGVAFGSGASVVIGGDDHDEIGHGTSCAERVLTRSAQAVVLPVKVFHTRLRCTVSVVAGAIRHAIEEGARVINLSLGTRNTGGFRELYSACRDAADAGAIVVAAHAVGDRVSAPAAFDCVIGVRAAPSEVASCVVSDGIDFAACGYEERALRRSGIRTPTRGSSLAAPVVSACVVELLVVRPNLTIDAVRAALVDECSRRPRCRDCEGKGVSQ